jgi:hypothetical protein
MSVGLSSPIVPSWIPRCEAMCCELFANSGMRLARIGKIWASSIEWCMFRSARVLSTEQVLHDDRDRELTADQSASHLQELVDAVAAFIEGSVCELQRIVIHEVEERGKLEYSPRIQY